MASAQWGREMVCVAAARTSSSSASASAMVSAPMIRAAFSASSARLWLAPGGARTTATSCALQRRNRPVNELLDLHAGGGGVIGLHHFERCLVRRHQMRATTQEEEALPILIALRQRLHLLFQCQGVAQQLRQAVNLVGSRFRGWGVRPEDARRCGGQDRRAAPPSAYS